MMIELRIKTLDGADHKISIDDESTVQELKDTIFAQMGVEQSLQRLIFCGRAMQDDKKLKEYKVHEKVVHMVQRAPPGPESRTSSSQSSSVPVTPENRQSNPINSSRVQQLFGLGGTQVVLEERRSGQSPTAIRLENLREIINDIKRSLSDLTGVIYTSQEMPPAWEVSMEEEASDGEGNARNSGSQNLTRPADFAKLMAEVNELERKFAPYRAEHLRIIRDCNTAGAPLREGDLQRRMGMVDRVSMVYHHLAHAYHLISDINLLMSLDNSRLTSEVFIRQLHSLQAPQNVPSVNITGDSAGGPLRQGNQNSNLPMNIGDLDPITVQLQIETRVPLPIGLGVLNVPRVQGQGQNQQAGQNNDSNRTENNERIGQTVPNVPPAAGQLHGRVEATNNLSTGDQQPNPEPTVDSVRERFRQLNDRQRDLIIQQFEETEDIDGFEVNFTIDDLPQIPLPLMQSVLHHISQSHTEQAQSSASVSVGETQNELLSASESSEEGSITQERNQNQPQSQQPLVPGNQQGIRIQHMPQNGTPSVASDNQRENPVVGFGGAGEIGAFELPIDMEELPLGNSIQNFLAGQQNVGGAEHNVFLAQMPLHGTQPNTEMIQQILTSVIRQGLLPGLLPNTNWQVIFPHLEPGANNANPAANPQSGTTQNPAQNEGSNEGRPNNQGPQNPNPQRSQPGPSAPRRFQLTPPGIRATQVVFDQIMPCESMHVRQAMRERSRIYPCDLLNQFTDSGSPRTLFNMESLYQRFERNQGSPYAIVLASHLILREALVPGVHRFLNTRDLILLATPLSTYVRDLLQSEFTEDSVDRLIDALIERHRIFYNRISQIVTFRPEVDFAASLRAVLRHYLRDFVGLLNERDPGDFCRGMRIFLPRFYHDFCMVVEYCLSEAISSFQELYRAFFIYLVENMDETTRDILYSIAMFNMYFATDRLERHCNRLRRPQFVVFLPQPQLYEPDEMSLLDEEDFLDASMSSAASTEETTTAPTSCPAVEDSPMPSSSTAGPPPEPAALPTRNIYSGTVPRTRPVMRTSRKVNNKMPVRYRSNVASSSSSASQSGSRNRTNPITPSTPTPSTPTPQRVFTPLGPSVQALWELNRRNASQSPARRDAPTAATPDNSEAQTVPMFPNIDLWGSEMQEILQRDSLSQTSQSVPFSDAYISGMPLKKRHCIRQARPPTTLNGFIEDTIIELEESIEIENRVREMFEEYIRAGVRDRRERSIDFHSDRFTSVMQLLNDEAMGKSTSSNDDNSRQDSGGAA